MSTLVHSFFDGSSSFLQVTRTTIIAWMSLNLGQILSPTTGLVAIDCLKNQCIMWERSGSVVECLTRDRRVAGSSLTGVTALWSLSKTHLS